MHGGFDLITCHLVIWLADESINLYFSLGKEMLAFEGLTFCLHQLYRYLVKIKITDVVIIILGAPCHPK